MSNEEKEQEKGFNVKDRRRFKMDEKGNVVDSEPETKTAQAPQSEQKPTPDSDKPKTPSAEDAAKKNCEKQYRDLPPITLTTLLLSLSTQAMVSMGELPDPLSMETVKNMALAKQSIDLLGILEEKTKGNLSPEEERFLKTSLTDLRIRFVECCKES